MVADNTEIPVYIRVIGIGQMSAWHLGKELAEVLVSLAAGGIYPRGRGAQIAVLKVKILIAPPEGGFSIVLIHQVIAQDILVT